LRLALVFVLCSASVGHAQDAITDEQRERARPIVDDANRAFDEFDYQRALELYRSAYEIAPVDTLRFNIARCLERLARFREAAAEWRAVIDGPSVPEDRRATAREQLEAARSRLGTVRIESAVHTSAVVDRTLECELPCSLELDPGSHVVVVRGATSEERAFDLARGDERVIRFEAPAEVHPTPIEARDRGWSVSWLGVTGVAALAVGTGGAIASGLRVNHLLDELELNPQDRIADEGDLMWALFVGSVGLGSAGLVAMLVDFVFQPFAD
jgi:hypothetical protein